MRDPGRPPTRLERPVPIDYGDDDRARFPAPPPPPPPRRPGGNGGDDGFHLGPREMRVLALIAGLAVVVAILVLPPISLLSRGGGSSDASQGVVTRERGSIPALPAGLEAASGFYDIEVTREVPTPLNFTVRLSRRSTDDRNLAFYTYHDNAWHRLASVATTEDGSGASGQLAAVPTNIAVLRRSALAHAFAAIIGPGETPDPATRDASIVSVLAAEPATGDEGLQLSDKLGANLQGEYLGITTSTMTAAAAVNRILGDLAATRRHVDAIAAAAEATRAAGVHVDYLGIDTNRRAAFSAFVQQLRDRLKQSNRGLVVTVPALPGNDAGAYDWVALSAASDAVWLRPPGDPAAYYDTLETALRTRREAGVDLSRVSLVLSRRSHERSGDLIRALTLRDALTTASALRTRVDQGIGVGDAVTLSGTNIDQDTGNSGLRWDDRARTVSFAYASRTGPRTVWLENRFSTAFRLDLARRYNLGGVVVEGAVQDEALPDVWNVILAWAGDNVIHLELPYGPYLQPAWRSNEGQFESTPASGAVVWRAPQRPGVYEITLVVSDGVIFVGQRLSLRVTIEGARTPTPTPTATPTGTAAPSGTAERTATPAGPALSHSHRHGHTRPRLMVRVIAGSARGIELRQPRGRGTRPTSGRLREALFSMLEAAEADFTEVLDLYAGTGALGIEALSRGEGRCTFVESDPRATDILRDNLQRAGLAERGRVAAAAVGRWRPPEGAMLTLVLADPPYADASAWGSITTTVLGALAPHALVVVEHAARIAAPDTLLGWPRWRDRRQGDGAVALYRRPQDGGTEEGYRRPAAGDSEEGPPA